MVGNSNYSGTGVGFDIHHYNFLPQYLWKKSSCSARKLCMFELKASGTKQIVSIANEGNIHSPINAAFSPTTKEWEMVLWSINRLNTWNGIFSTWHNQHQWLCFTLCLSGTAQIQTHARLLPLYAWSTCMVLPLSRPSALNSSPPNSFCFSFYKVLWHRINIIMFCCSSICHLHEKKYNSQPHETDIHLLCMQYNKHSNQPDAPAVCFTWNGVILWVSE